MDDFKHERYAIYELTGKKIKTAGARGIAQEVEGIVDNVWRDVLNDKIMIKIKNGREASFPEPTKIIYKDNKLVFLYNHYDYTQNEKEAVLISVVFVVS